MKNTLLLAGFTLFIVISISALCLLLSAMDTITNIIGVIYFFIFIYVTCIFSVKLYNMIFENKK